MTPIWIFPAYPLLIIGPHAANLSQRLPSASSALQVIIGGFTIQGMGFLVSLTIYSAFVYRLMTQKIPPEPLRPAMFVSVGPSAFTVSGLIGMAQNLPKALSPRSEDLYMGLSSPLAAEVLKIVANWASLWLWGLAFWFFFVSLAANLACLRDKHHQIPFAMTWFSFIFPQTALTSATLKVGEAFHIKAIQWIGCVMAVLLVGVWIFVMTMMIRAIIRKEILWPEKGEDRREGGFEMETKVRKEQQKDLEDGPLHETQPQTNDVGIGEMEEKEISPEENEPTDVTTAVDDSRKDQNGGQKTAADLNGSADFFSMARRG